ncbi:MAG: flagellar motor switch protein FliN [Janthinobacterium lividum]
MADMENGGMLSQADLDALIASAGQDSAESENFFGAEEVETEDLEVESEPVPSPGIKPPSMGGLVDLPNFGPAASAPALSLGSETGLGRVRDIPLEVTVELGRTRLLIRDIMDLSAGSIIELDKIAGEPVDLFANGMLVARGEVIVIDDNFGVRVTEIITAKDRGASEKESHARAA